MQKDTDEQAGYRLVQYYYWGLKLLTQYREFSQLILIEFVLFKFAFILKTLDHHISLYKLRKQSTELSSNCQPWADEEYIFSTCDKCIIFLSVYFILLLKKIMALSLRHRAHTLLYYTGKFQTFFIWTYFSIYAHYLALALDKYRVRKRGLSFLLLNR